MSAGEHYVLVIEDEQAIRRFLRASLDNAGYRVAEATSGAEGLRMATSSPPDLIILDLGLPDLDGQEVLLRLREWYTAPIIILSARDQEPQKIKALDLGADDYVTKPFGVAELLARIRSALRHGVQLRGAMPIVHVGDVEIDLAARRVLKAGSEIKLSRKEFDLLATLAADVGQPVAHERLLEQVWGSPDADIRYLRVYIGQVRDKIEDNPQAPRLIVSTPGFGYTLRQ